MQQQSDIRKWWRMRSTPNGRCLDSSPQLKIRGQCKLVGPKEYSGTFQARLMLASCCWRSLGLVGTRWDEARWGSLGSAGVAGLSLASAGMPLGSSDMRVPGALARV